jgi:hypothetical protein
VGEGRLTSVRAGEVGGGGGGGGGGGRGGEGATGEQEREACAGGEPHGDGGGGWAAAWCGLAGAARVRAG